MKSFWSCMVWQKKRAPPFKMKSNRKNDSLSHQGDFMPETQNIEYKGFGETK